MKMEDLMEKEFKKEINKLKYKIEELTVENKIFSESIKKEMAVNCIYYGAYGPLPKNIRESEKIEMHEKNIMELIEDRFNYND